MFHNIARSSLPSLSFGVLAAALLAASAALSASSYRTPPVGCFPLQLIAGEETAVGLPLERGATFTGRLAAVDVATGRLSVAASPGWTTDFLAGQGAGSEFHYCVVLSGELAGARFPVIGNGADSFAIHAGNEDLSLLAADATGFGGDRVRLVPYWTPASLFAQTTLPAGVEMLLFDGDGPGAGTGPAEVLTYFGTSGWVDSTGGPADGYPLRTGRGFFARLPAGGADLTVDLLGHVPMTAERHVFSGFEDGGGSEVLFALNHPEPVELASAGFEFTDRTQVYTFEGASGYRSNPSGVFTYYEGYGWFDQRFRPVGTNAVLTPGKAYFVRLPAVVSNVEWVWTRQPDYLAGL